MPLLPQGAADRAAREARALLAFGATGGLAGMPDNHRPAATRSVGRGRRRSGGAAAVQLYGMYLAVPSARRAAEEAARLGGVAASTVLGPAWGQGLDSRQGYREQLADEPLRPAPTQDPTAAARPAGGMAVGAQLCGGPGALGLGATVGTGLRPGHLRRAGRGLRVPQQPGAPGQARPSARPASVVVAGTSAAGGARPAAAPTCQRDPARGTLSVDVHVSGAPGGFRSMGRTEQPVFACLPDM